MLDLRAPHRAPMVDGAVRTDVGVVDDGALTDDRRAAHRAVAQLSPGLDDHLALEADVVGEAPRTCARLHVVEDDAIGLQQILEPAGVLPGRHRGLMLRGDEVRSDVAAGVDHPLDGVGDLQLAARRVGDRRGGLEDGRGEEVDAHQSEVRLRDRGLLDQPDHPPVDDLGHPEVLRLRHLGEQDHGVGVKALEFLDDRDDAVAHQVVAQVHDEAAVTEELPRRQHRVGEPFGRLLRDVGAVGTECGPVADRGPHLGTGLAGDDPDLRDPSRDDGLDGVEEDRLVGDGDELLGAGVGDRPQARALAAAQDQTLHLIRAPGCRSPALHPRTRFLSTIADGNCADAEELEFRAIIAIAGRGRHNASNLQEL